MRIRVIIWHVRSRTTYLLTDGKEDAGYCAVCVVDKDAEAGWKTDSCYDER